MTREYHRIIGTMCSVAGRIGWLLLRREGLVGCLSDLGDLGRREDSTLFAQVAAKTPGLDHHYAVEDSDAAAADWSTVNGDDRAYVDRQSVQRPPQGCGGLPCLSTGLGHLAVLSVGAVPQGSAVRSEERRVGKERRYAWSPHDTERRRASE